RRLQGADRRRLEGLRSPGRSPGREEGRHRPDGRLRGLRPPAGTERSPPLFPPVAEPHALLNWSPPMSVSFSLSNANAADVLDALGIEDSFSERPWPIPCFRALLIVARRKRLGHASPAIPVTETQEPGKMLVIDCGRPEGYIEQKLSKLSDLVNEGIEIGATRVGWGQPPILRPTTE